MLQMMKGLNANICVALDWQWRQERATAFQTRKSYPKTAYSFEAIKLHDELSVDMALQLDMPLLILVSEYYGLSTMLP